MSKSDYYRPSEQQIHNHFRCDQCRKEIEVTYQENYSGGRCVCGGTFQASGESYPANTEKWDEERDDTNSDWHRRR